MSSSNSKEGSSPENDPAKPTPIVPIPIQDITQRLHNLRLRLSEAKVDRQKASKGAEGITGSHVGEGDHSSSTDTESTLIQLDKACNELNYMISAFRKLQNFEADLSEPLETLESNVNDILTDLSQASTETVKLKPLIERNLKVLRSNITKLKVQIPLQHQASSSTISEARRFLQTTVASKEVGHLPNPYEADGIFESSSFLKEFQDHHYNTLDTRDKLCLLCFSIFPEKAEVKKRLLRFWWDGERFTSRPAGSNEKFSVKKTLGKFVEKGFIEPVTKRSRSQSTSYKMDPIIRSFIIRLAKEANFFDYDPKGNPTMDISKSKKSCLVKSEGTSWWTKNILLQHPNPKPEEQQPNFMETQQKDQEEQQQPKSMENHQGQKGEQQPKSRENQQGQKEKQQPKKRENEKKGEKQLRDEEMQRIIQEKQKEKQREKHEKQRIKHLEKLQTLFNVSKQFPDLPEELFSKMKNIGVLYLGRWERTAERHMEVENTEFLTGLKNMKKLRFLSLQGISGISKLPKSICNLSNLRILDLRACHNLEGLPKKIGSLKMLTHLDLSECYLLDNIPKQLSQLSNLKVLKGFVISKNTSCTLDNLTALNKLEKLSINVNTDNFSINEEEKSTVFSKFASLKKLKIAWGAGGDGAKSTNGNKVNNEAKSTPRDNGEKKVNGNRKSNAAKSRDHKKQENEAPKSGAAKALQKLKIPWGASCGEGSSKSVPENKVAVATAKPGEVVKTQDENRDAKVVAATAKPGKFVKTLDRDAKKPVDAAKAKAGPSKPQEMKLVKLDLECCPEREPPRWLVPENLTHLKRLYIRGGGLGNLGEISTANSNKKWMVEILRLKYLTDVKINWKELQTQFPELKLLEKVSCPQITFCPCDASGVWVWKQQQQQQQQP